MCVLNKTKCLNVKAFGIITIINEAKTLLKHIPCDCKCKFYSVTCNSIQKWNNYIFQCECKNYSTCKKVKSGILAHLFVRVASI